MSSTSGCVGWRSACRHTASVRRGRCRTTPSPARSPGWRWRSTRSSRPSYCRCSWPPCRGCWPSHPEVGAPSLGSAARTVTGRTCDRTDRHGGLRRSYDPTMDKLDGEGPVRLAGGNVATAHDWDVAAAAVLRRGRRLAQDAPDEAAWDALAGTTVEGLVIPPLGTPERAARRAAVLAPAANAGRVDTGWDIRSLLTDPDPEVAASSALADLENGATSLWVTVGGGG